MKQKYTGFLLLFSLFLLMNTGTLQAQYFPVCVDTTIIIPNYYCDTTGQIVDFTPVCGCDGVSYFNACVAGKLHGIIKYTDGPCEDNMMYFSPNPVYGFYDLNLFVAVKDPTQITHLYIINIFNFKIYYEKYYQVYPINNYIVNDTIGVEDFPQGCYAIIIITGGTLKVKKFIKLDGY